MAIKGFTPAVDSITEKHGIMTATVYGRIWRFAQMSELRVCTASQSKIAKYLGVERETVNRHIKILKDNGFLREVSKVKGGTVTYAPLIDIVTKVSIEAEGCDLEEHPPVTESNTKKEVIKKENLGGDLVDAMLKYNKPEQANFSDYPADVQVPLLMFQKHFPKIKVDNKAKWIKQARVWGGMGLTSNDIEGMCKYAKENFKGIAQPASITSAYNMMQTKNEYDAVSERAKAEAKRAANS